MIEILLWSKTGDELDLIAKWAGCVVYGTHEECVSKLAQHVFDMCGCLDEAIDELIGGSYGNIIPGPPPPRARSLSRLGATGIS